jgi:hypothetical protein
MKDIAFLVLAHTDPVQVGRLCRALDYRARIYVHLDAKVDIRPFLAQPLPESVTFIKDRVRVSWAAYSQVEATLRMMRAALDSGHDFSHLVMLSGLDYPIKPLTVLHDHLNRHRGHEFIRFVDATQTDYRVYFDRYWFLEANSALPPKLDRALRHGFGRAIRPFLSKSQPESIGKVCWGSAYWALTPECVAYVLDFAGREADFVRWASSSFAVDEHFFHTIIGNSDYCAVSDGFSPYEGNKTYRMASLHQVHESMRKVYTEADFNELCDSDKFFVRKIVSGQSDRLVERLNAEILYADTASARLAESARA